MAGKGGGGGVPKDPVTVVLPRDLAHRLLVSLAQGEVAADAKSKGKGKS